MNVIDQKKRMHFLDHAYEISQDYKDWRRIYLEINIGFTSFFSLALNFILDALELNVYAKNVLYFGFIILLALTSWNIFYNLIEHATKYTVKSWYHYRNHFKEITKNTKKKGKKINCEDFVKYCELMDTKEKVQLKNDWRDLFNLYKYQDNYYKLLKRTRIFTLLSLLEFLILFGVSIGIHLFCPAS